MKILVGSSALRNYLDPKRPLKDCDYFYDGKEEIKDNNCNRVETYTHPKLEEWFGEQERVATLDELYTIKVSHIFWDLKGSSWDKHCFDIMNMKKAGAKLDPEFYEVLYSIWEERYGKKQANLNAMPEDFFNKNVTRIYDHDSIHASVAYEDEPMFKKILKDGHPVLVDRNKWDMLTTDRKYNTVREEVYATALERQVIPSNYTTSPRAAYHWALKKTITSFSKGWFPLFIIEHLEDLWNPDINYVARHNGNSHKLIRLKEV